MPHRTTRIVPLALALALAGCATETAPPPPIAAPPPAPPVVAPPPPAPLAWADLPISAGSWSYVADATGSTASYGAPATAAFTLHCTLATRQIALTRTGGGSGLTIKTSYGERSLAASGGVALLAASDPLLDQIAFSRARVSIDSPGVSPLMMPAWAEPARVIEDCRVTAP